MVEKTKEVIAKKIYYECDKCKKGNMIPTEVIGVGTFQHICRKCGYLVHLKTAYPYLSFCMDEAGIITNVSYKSKYAE